MVRSWEYRGFPKLSFEGIRVSKTAWWVSFHHCNTRPSLNPRTTESSFPHRLNTGFHSEWVKVLLHEREQAWTWGKLSLLYKIVQSCSFSISTCWANQSCSRNRLELQSMNIQVIVQIHLNRWRSLANFNYKIPLLKIMWKPSLILFWC